MSLQQILVLVGISLCAACLLPPRWVRLVIFFTSIISLYWLQPASPIHGISFWLPTISIFLTLATWTIIHDDQQKDLRNNLFYVVILTIFILFLSASRYIGQASLNWSIYPPPIHIVLIGISAAFLSCMLLYYAKKKILFSWILILTLICIFIILKQKNLVTLASETLRTFNKQDPNLAAPLDLQWMGISYLIFRLIHVLRDYQNRQIRATNLKDFIDYALFFPSLIAGPIDRYERFNNDINKNQQQKSINIFYTKNNLINGGKRIFFGLFKKFVLADTLALIALNSTNIYQFRSSTSMIIALYAYSLRIFFDFSGYTDIAIGMGNLLGIQLPENFNNPYLKTSLISFWNSWHITLAQWFRSYFFNPITRKMRTYQEQIPAWIIIMVGQVSTMVLIGLWHGISWNFLFWGLWHGFGLFINNRWADYSRSHPNFFNKPQKFTPLVTMLNWLLTFNYVTLGWIWFALPSPSASLQVFKIILKFLP